MTDRDYRVYVLINGERYPIARDVAHHHPPAVHAALGTRNERELQHVLDNTHVDDFYDAEGRHRGPDPWGLVLEWTDAPYTTR